MAQPSISSINSDESIVTFTTQEINDDILVEYGGSIIGEFTAPKEFSLTTGYTVGDGDIVITTNSNVSRVVASYGNSDIIDDSNGNSIYTIQCNGKYMETDIVVDVYASTSTINFTIDGTTYTANSGMTWSQWVDSAYNTDGYYVNLQLNYIMIDMGDFTYQAVAYSDRETAVQPSETITPNYAYAYLSGN